MRITKVLAMLTAAVVALSGYGLRASAAEPVAVEPAEMQERPVYGNTMGNIVGGGLLLQDENYFYMYHVDNNCVYRTDKATGLSDRLIDGRYVELNMLNGKIYGNNIDAGIIMEIDPASGAVRALRQGNVDYMLAVDNELYYVDTNRQYLCKLDIDNKIDDSVVVPYPVSTPNVGKDAVYFALPSDNYALYSMPRNGGGDMRKLNNTPSYMPTLYQDKIYYGAEVNGKPAICVMGLDGSGERVIAQVAADALNIYGDKLFYLGGADKNEIYFIDLAVENAQPVLFPLAERLEAAARQYGNFKNYKLIQYAGLNFIPGYLAVMCAEKIDGQVYLGEYIFDMATAAVMPVKNYAVDRAGAGRSSDRYTPEEAVAVYRSIMEAGGIKWNPSLKGNWDETIGKYPIEEWYLHSGAMCSSWGTGFIYLQKGHPEWSASTALDSFAFGGGDASDPWTDFYFEVTGSDENYVYIVEWHA